MLYYKQVQILSEAHFAHNSRRGFHHQPLWASYETLALNDSPGSHASHSCLTVKTPSGRNFSIRPGLPTLLIHPAGKNLSDLQISNQRQLWHSTAAPGALCNTGLIKGMPKFIPLKIKTTAIRAMP